MAMRIYDDRVGQSGMACAALEQYLVDGQHRPAGMALEQYLQDAEMRLTAGLHTLRLIPEPSGQSWVGLER